MKEFITSDLHYFHKNILEFSEKRSVFDDVADMNDSLITEWNSKVGYNDTIYHLGDFSDSLEELLSIKLKDVDCNYVKMEKTSQGHFSEGLTEIYYVNDKKILEVFCKTVIDDCKIKLLMEVKGE